MNDSKVKGFPDFYRITGKKIISVHFVKRKRLYKIRCLKINSLLRHINDVIMAGNFINPYTGCYQ